MRIIDLTMTIEAGMLTYPARWHPSVEITQIGYHDLDGRETRRIVVGTHTGTHIDAPRHFINCGESIKDIDLEHINGKCIVIDIPNDIKSISKDFLIERIGERSPRRILLRHGWDINYGNLSYYNGYPYIEFDAAYWLVTNGCWLIGMDTPSPDDPMSIDMPVHRTFLDHGVVIVEYLVNMNLLPTEEDVDLIVAPLKIKDGDGAPARVFCRID